MKTLILTILITFILVVSCNSEKVKFETFSEIQNVFDLAKKENKKIFMLVTDSNCGSCSNFVTRINTEQKTARILNQNYISFKADVNTLQGKEFAALLRCPSFPFPYFFNSDGTLEAFGFPNKPNFDISDLNTITIDEVIFREIFRLPINRSSYKKLITSTLKSKFFFDKSENEPYFIDSSLFYLHNSLAIIKYPFNIILSKKMEAFSLPINIEDTKGVVASLTPAEFTYYDQKEIDLIETFTDSKHLDTGLTFDRYNINLGIMDIKSESNFEFSFINKLENSVKIDTASHPCDCIQLDWSKYSISRDSLGYVKGTFKPYEKGSFKKNIYVHYNNKMDILEITGVVN